MPGPEAPRDGGAPGQPPWLRGRHRAMLAVCTAIVGLSFLMTTAAPGSVHVLGTPWLRLPPLCPSRALLDTRCPGCGLTRSFIHLAHGDLAASLRCHRAGWLLALAVLGQIPYRIAALRHPTGHPLGRDLPRLFGLALIAILIGCWLFFPPSP